jgi:hypothetical protein
MPHIKLIDLTAKQRADLEKGAKCNSTLPFSYAVKHCPAVRR